MTAGYEAGVAKLLKRTGRMLLVFVAMSAGAGWLFMNLPTSFLPDEDQGTVFDGNLAAELDSRADRKNTR